MKVRKPNGRKDGHAGKPKVQARSDDPAAVKLARVESMQANERPPDVSAPAGESKCREVGARDPQGPYAPKAKQKGKADGKRRWKQRRYTPVATFRAVHAGRETRSRIVAMSFCEPRS